MARVTTEEVAAILTEGTDLKSVPSCINTAFILVNEDLVDSGYSEDRKTQIELYLSAHFCVIANGGHVLSRRIDEAEDKFQRSNGSSPLSSTNYGAQALALDINGLISSESCTIELLS